MSHAADTIESYLVELDRLLPASRRERAELLAELRDGLLEASGAHERSGLAPAEAALLATNEFGEPAELASLFAPELAARRARRIAKLLLATGPLIGGLWGATAVGSHALHTLQDASGVWLEPIHVALAIAIGTATAAAALCLLATGRPGRSFALSARFPLATVATSALAAVVVDSSVLGVLFLAVLARPSAIAWAPAGLAAAASLSRLTLTTRATRQLLPA